MQRLRAWKHWPWLRDFALIAVFFFAVRAYQQRDIPSGAAPELAGVDLDGAPASLRDYRGKPVLLYFWATWCGVCKAQRSNIDALAGDFPVLTVVSRSGDANAVRAYVREHGIEPRAILDTSGALAQRFGINAFPTTFVIDADGDIAHSEVGYTTELGLRARLWLARMW